MFLDPETDFIHNHSGCRAPYAAIFSSNASMRAKPALAPCSTPYCMVVSRYSLVSKRIVWVSFVCSPRSSNSSVCRWFWNVCTRRLRSRDPQPPPVHVTRKVAPTCIERGSNLVAPMPSGAAIVRMRYSTSSRKLSTRCLSSVAAPSSYAGRLLSANRC